MSILKETWLRFPASDSPDVVSNKLYIEEAPGVVTDISQAFDIGNTLVDIEGVPNVEVNLAAIAGMTTLDAVYNIGVAAVDDRGNEASRTLLNDVPLDFSAPNPVGALAISDT